MNTHTHTHDNTHIMRTVGDGHHSQNGSPSTGNGMTSPTPEMTPVEWSPKPL